MGLSGDLEAFGLAELLQVLVMGKKSGVLTLAQGKTPGGLLVLQDGRLVHAASAAGLEGEQALFAFLREAQGLFTFRTFAAGEAESFPTTITRSLDSLLLTAHRGDAQSRS